MPRQLSMIESPDDWVMTPETKAAARRGIAMCRAILWKDPEYLRNPQHRQPRRRRRPDPVAKVLRHSADDLRRGVDPNKVAVRLTDVADKIDPHYIGRLA